MSDSNNPNDQSGSGNNGSNRGGGNVATLASIRNQPSTRPNDGQAFYAGGSEHSGQQILGPNRSDPEAIIRNMFHEARQHAIDPEADDEDEDDEMSGFRSGQPARSLFAGVGSTLGSSESDSRQVQGAPIQKPIQRMMLRLWRNGFSLDDGPLRAYNEPQNEEFMTSVRQGRVPKELTRDGATEVRLSMSDHRDQNYEPPKGPARAFQGEGQRLGTPAADLIAQSVSAAPTDSGSRQSALAQANLFLTLDQNQPHTRIQIRLVDGTTLVAQINVNRTVGDLRQFICIARPEFAALPFDLMTTFPNKVLDNLGGTVKECGLANSAIVQRLSSE